jgi:hypothetical protein
MPIINNNGPSINERTPATKNNLKLLIIKIKDLIPIARAPSRDARSRSNQKRELIRKEQTYRVD